MSTESTAATDIQVSPRRVHEFRRFMKVFLNRKIVIIGLIIIIIFIITAVFAPLLAPYNPNEQNVLNGRQQPSGEHLLGTDPLGRDVLSRIIYGSRTSLLIGIIVVGFSAVFGMTLGLIAGYFGRWVYTIIMRVIDALMAFPMLVLTLLIASLLGSGLNNVIIALSVGLIPIYARLMCGQVIHVRENDYIVAEVALGSSHWRTDRPDRPECSGISSQTACRPSSSLLP
jgi:ABC-type dipeptide/oligopeptide/nickel transport system permease subunit